MVLDGTRDAERRLNSMIYWDMHNGLVRRSWARNDGANLSIKRALKENPKLKVTKPNFVDEDLLSKLF
jgi:urocanate hydratase